VDAPKVEFDAVPVEELRRRVRKAVEGLLEWDTWERYVQTQQVELKCIDNFVRRMKSLPSCATRNGTQIIT